MSRIEAAEKFLEKPWKFLGFVALLVFGYLRPEQLIEAVGAYGILAGSNTWKAHIKTKNGVDSNVMVGK